MSQNHDNKVTNEAHEQQVVNAARRRFLGQTAAATAVIAPRDRKSVV